MAETPAQPRAPELSVVVPVKNEEANVGPLIAEITAALRGRSAFEILYIDDGSDDGTPAALRAARADTPELRILRHESCAGQSAAILTGVRSARSAWVATLDGDGQNDPADIPALLAARDAAPEPARDPGTGGAGVTLVAGQRLSRRDSALKRLSSRVANVVRSRLLRDHARDTGCGLKLFRRDAYLELPAFDHMHRFLPALFARGGGVVLFVGVSHRARTRGRSKYGLHNRLWVGVVDLVGVMWLNRRPVRPVAREERQDRGEPTP